MTIKKSLIILNVLNIIDYISTVFFIKYYNMVEINPLMNFLFDYNIGFLKVLFVGFLIVLLIVLTEKYNYYNLKIDIVLFLLVYVYLTIIIRNIILFILR